MAKPIPVQRLGFCSSPVLLLQFLFFGTTIAFSCDDYGYGTRIEALKTACPTVSQFCSSLVGFPRLKPTVTYTFETTYETVFMATKTKHVKTLVTYVSNHKYAKTSTRTRTIGKSTKTVENCAAAITCGASTVQVPDCYRYDCTNYLRKTEFEYSTTQTVSHATKTTTVASTTKRSSGSATATSYKIKTVRVATATKHVCPTAAPPVHNCGNAGYEFAHWQLTETDYDNGLMPWDLDYYKTTTPISNDTGIGEIPRLFASYYDVYYYYENVCEKAYRSWRGYIYAPQTGNYTFRVPTVTTLADIWIGDVAYSAYNSSNTFLSTTGRGEKIIHFDRGNYYPFRIAFACVAQGYAFFLNIEQPNGLIFEGTFDPIRDGYYPDYFPPYYHYDYTYGWDTNYLVQFGCGEDESIAPKFPAWGNEI